MAYILLCMTALFWAGNFVLGRAMHLVLPPITMAEMRWSLALLLILPFLIPRLKRNAELIKSHIWRLIGLGIVSVASFNTLIYVGLTSTTATNATLLQSAVPIVILLVSAIFLKESVSMRQWCGVVCSLLGVLTLVTAGEPAALLHLSINEGDLFVLGAVLCWALYSIALRWKPKGLDGFTFFGVTVIVGVIALMPFTWWELQRVPAITFEINSALTVLYMAICPSILAYIFWNKGVEELGAAKAGLFIHLMPLFGIVLSALFLGESIRSYHWVGMVLIFTGLYVAVIANALKQIQKNTLR
jgi:drug/metabolite transporter (DMT)-like permease